MIDDAKEEGRQEGCQNLLKGMLSSMGTLPDEVVQRIDQEKSLDQISEWVELAAKTDKMEDFISRM